MSELTQPPSVKVGMLVRRPVGEVFQAIADPAVTTRFWYTKSSGKMTSGAHLTWEWEMYGLTADISVKEVDHDSRIVFEWNQDDPTTVEIRFVPVKGDTYVQLTETGFGGAPDEVVPRVIGSTGGFTNLLAALKAFLEHDIVLTVVRDHRPAGLEV